MNQKTLYVYKAVSFPYKWVKCPPMLDNIRLVDTTPFMVNDRIFALTYKLNESKKLKDELILLEFDGEQFRLSTQGVISTDISVARPGGKFFYIEDKLFRVSQDCKSGYGAALNIIEVKKELESKYEEKIIKKISPNEVKISKNKTAKGIHTYNFSDKFEVIDLKYYKRSFIRLFYKFLKLK
ncbi:MAG: hypothetical protein LUF33_01965 [Clostridiales bacterium]|nr:hypothetical protein [Clostridiales bacterium]